MDDLEGPNPSRFEGRTQSKELKAGTMERYVLMSLADKDVADEPQQEERDSAI